jgi:hypothetical protein
MAIFPDQGHQQKKQLERRVKQVSFKRRNIFVALHKNVATFKFSTYSKKNNSSNWILKQQDKDNELLLG